MTRHSKLIYTRSGSRHRKTSGLPILMKLFLHGQGLPVSSLQKHPGRTILLWLVIKMLK
jgi:hypothetical protein